MASKVLLVMCPMWGTCLPPMGPAYMAAYLEHKGIACDVLDLNISLYHAAAPQQRDLWKMENFHAWTREDGFGAIRAVFAAEIERRTQAIVDQGVSVAGFTISGANVLFSIEMATVLRRKKPDICIVFGGPSCNFFHEDLRMPFRFFTSSVNGDVLLKDGVVDYIVLGEGEESLHEIVLAHFAGVPLKRPGVVSGTPSKMGKIERSAQIQALDAIPFPAWDKLPLDKYDVQDELPILFSRGCINACAFCNDWRMWGGRFRYRSASNIFEEIKMIRNRYRKKAFRCNDLLFNGNLKVLDELADLIIASGLVINWTAQGFVRTDMKLELFVKLQRAGLTTIVYGVESLSDNVLQKMGKRFTFDQIHTILKRTKAAHINVWINLIMGFPGETQEDVAVVRQRLELVRDYVDTVSSLNPCNITASTDLELFPDKFGIIYPEGKDRCEAWETADGLNTYEVRKQRAHEIFVFLRSLRIRTHFVGIYDGGSPSQLKGVSRAEHVQGNKIPMYARRLLKIPVFLCVCLFHLFLAIYMHGNKVVRKTVIFPGA